MSCAPCTKVKAACKPFDADKTCAKARAETVQRLKAKKTKQQMDAEWKAEVSRKLEDLSELWGLRKDIWRIAVALEKLAGIENQESEEDQFSWLEFEGDEMEVQRSKKKGKQKEERTDKAEEEEEIREQKEENRMEVFQGHNGPSLEGYLR